MLRLRLAQGCVMLTVDEVAAFTSRVFAERGMLGVVGAVGAEAIKVG